MKNSLDPKDKNVLLFSRKESKKECKVSEPFFNFGSIPALTKILFWTLLLVHVGISLSLDAGHTFSLFYHFGFVPNVFTDPSNYSWRMIFAPLTSLFLHGGWMHLFLNLIMLSMMGIYFEREFGAQRFAVCLVICGLAGNFFYLILSPFESVPVIGASGAINGIFAMVFLDLYKKGKMGPLLHKNGKLIFILLWLALILIGGILSHDISWQSHMGGFLAGLALSRRFEVKKI